MNYPRKVAIGFQEGTCPLHCPKCFAFNGKSGRKKEVRKMPIAQARQLIDEISGWEQKPVIQPHIFTEPFANQDLKTIIKYCHEKGLPVSIITNGILIDESWNEFILSELNRKDTISFSLDAVSQATYEKVRGKYKLAELEEKVKYLLVHRAGERGPKISVNYTVEEENYREVKNFIDRWIYKADAVRATVAIDDDKKIPDMFRREGIENVSACGYLDETMTIDSDGHVRVCQYDAFGDSDFGNVFEKGVMEIWKGKDLERYRVRQKNGELSQDDYCYQCEGSCNTKLRCREDEHFIVNEAAYTIYFNRKGR